MCASRSCRLNGTNYPIAITAEGNDGIYSNVDSVDVTLDFNRDGKFEDNEHFLASKPFTLNGQTFVISGIAENGSTMSINRS